MSEEPFVLHNDLTPEQHMQAGYDEACRKWTEHVRQRMLFDGLDCLPGQMDLFEDDPE